VICADSLIGRRKLTVFRKRRAYPRRRSLDNCWNRPEGDRFETVGLLSSPIEAVREIRRKGEARQMLSRAQWSVQAC